MNKIQKVSKFFNCLFYALLIILPILFIISWIVAPEPLGIMYSKTGILFQAIPEGLRAKIMVPLASSTKFLAATISLIPLTINLLILFFLTQLFKLYQQGIIFTLNNVRYIKKIGITLLIGQLLNPVYEGLLSIVLTWHNPPSHRMATISFTGTNIGIILTALGVILISWIMAEGYKLKQEQQYTI